MIQSTGNVPSQDIHRSEKNSRAIEVPERFSERFAEAVKDWRPREITDTLPSDIRNAEIKDHLDTFTVILHCVS